MLGTRPSHRIIPGGKAPGPELRNSEPAVARTHSLSTEAAECQPGRLVGELNSPGRHRATSVIISAATAPARGSGRELL
eukprot:250833-Hanusia_phi.AAC.1